MRHSSRSPPPPWRSASGAPTAADISTSPYLLGDWGALALALPIVASPSRLPKLERPPFRTSWGFWYNGLNGADLYDDANRDPRGVTGLDPSDTTVSNGAY